MSTIVEDPAIPLVTGKTQYQMYSKEQAVKKKRKYDNVGYRLAKRKSLFSRRKIICDFALFFAVVGIALMILETELCLQGVFSKDATESLLLKLSITLSTITLLGFVCWYHILDIKLFMCDNSLDDWSLAMSTKRILSISFELLIYAIHPIPGRYEFYWSSYDETSGVYIRTTVPIDVIFSVPMFLRLFLVGRVVMLHSKLFTDASSQSLGALNRINFNFKFIFKSMMTINPEYVLTVLMISVLLIASWLLRACEMYHSTEQSSMLNTSWVGYGDIVPESYCGRGIAVLTGMFGAGYLRAHASRYRSGCTALVVAVLARKLELSRAEKYVHNFVIDVELDKRNKIAASDIVKAGWFVYKNKKSGNDKLVRKYQRKLLKAIHKLRDIKHEQRRLADSGVTMTDMYRMQNGVFDLMKRFEQQQIDAETHIAKFNERMNIIEEKLDNIVRLVKK